MTNLTIGTSPINAVDGLYNLNDLHRASGSNPNHRPNQFMRLDQTRELITEIENAQICAFKVLRGVHGGTYAIRELVIAYAAWISPEFHLKVIRVFLAAAAPAAPAPAPVVCTLPGHGRYLVVADGDGVRVHSAAGKSLLQTDRHRALRRDTHILIDALREWAARARVVEGEANLQQLEQPLQINFKANGVRP